MLRRILLSAALASSLFAADRVLLTLFLNPDAAPRAEAMPLARALFMPYAVAGASVLLLLAVQVDAWLFPLRGRAAAAALVVLAAAAAVVVPLALRPAREPAPAPVPLATESIEPARRIVLIGIDGMGPDQLADGISRGTLPAFAQALRRGAHGPLATLRPTEGPP